MTRLLLVLTLILFISYIPTNTSGYVFSPEYITYDDADHLTTGLFYSLELTKGKKVVWDVKKMSITNETLNNELFEGVGINENDTVTLIVLDTGIDILSGDVSYTLEITLGDNQFSAKSTVTALFLYPTIEKWVNVTSSSEDTHIDDEYIMTWVDFALHNFQDNLLPPGLNYGKSSGRTFDNYTGHVWSAYPNISLTINFSALTGLMIYFEYRNLDDLVIIEVSNVSSEKSDDVVTTEISTVSSEKSDNDDLDFQFYQIIWVLPLIFRRKSRSIQ